MAAVRVVSRDARDTLGEGALWSAREQALYWVDILGRRVNRYDPATGHVRAWEMPDTIGWLIETARTGEFVAGLGRAFVRLRLDPFEITPLAAPEPERDGNRFNDAKADPAGRIWAGSMPLDCDRPTGAFYRLDVDGRATRVDDGYTIPNGPAIAPDGAWLLHTDTALRTIFRYRIEGTGGLAPREPWVVFPDDWGAPDGMTFDATGGLWVACWGAGCVRRFHPDGTVDRVIALPATQITSCTFAGPGLETMFVTSAAAGVDEAHGGALFEIDPGCRGLPTQPYRG